MKATDHTTTVTTLPDGRHQAQCSCGQRWPAPTRGLAETLCLQHQRYHAEVRAMIEGQGERSEAP